MSWTIQKAAVSVVRKVLRAACDNPAPKPSINWSNPAARPSISVSADGRARDQCAMQTTGRYGNSARHPRRNRRLLLTQWISLRAVDYCRYYDNRLVFPECMLSRRQLSWPAFIRDVLAIKEAIRLLHTNLSRLPEHVSSAPLLLLWCIWSPVVLIMIFHQFRLFLVTVSAFNFWHYYDFRKPVCSILHRNCILI